MLQDSNKPESHIVSYKAYVTGVKDGIVEDDLREYFSQFGAVESAEIIVDRDTGRSRGFAFVSFNDYDAVDKIVRKFCVYYFLQLFWFFYHISFYQVLQF